MQELPSSLLRGLPGRLLAPGPAPAPGPGPATISLTNYQAAQRVLAELTSALGGPAAIEALLAGRRAAAADNAAA
eukprot:tig00020542_g10446.t1